MVLSIACGVSDGNGLGGSVGGKFGLSFEKGNSHG